VQISADTETEIPHRQHRRSSSALRRFVSATVNPIKLAYDEDLRRFDNILHGCIDWIWKLHWQLSCLYGSICTTNWGLKLGFCTISKGYTQFFPASATVLLNMRRRFCPIRVPIPLSVCLSTSWRIIKVFNSLDLATDFLVGVCRKLKTVRIRIQKNPNKIWTVQKFDIRADGFL